MQGWKKEQGTSSSADRDRMTLLLHLWVQLRPLGIRMCCLLMSKGMAWGVSKHLRTKKENIWKLLLSLASPYKSPFFYHVMFALPNWTLSHPQDISAALPYLCHIRCRFFFIGHSCLVQSLHLTLSS